MSVIRAFFKFLVFGIIILMMPSRGYSKDGCFTSALKNIVKNTPEDQLTRNVDLIYYPKSDYTGVSHVELSVQGKVWNSTGSYKINNDYRVLERKALQGGKGFYRFKIRATEDEIVKLQRYLSDREGKRGLQNCISGACKALNRGGIVYVPPPFSKAPALNALYWRLTKTFGYNRIESITYVGKSQWKTLLGFQIPLELVTTVFYGGILVIGMDAAGEKIYDLLKVELKDKAANFADPGPIDGATNSKYNKKE